MNVVASFTAFVLIALGISCLFATVAIATMVYGNIWAAATQNPAPIAGMIFTVLTCKATSMYLIRTDHDANN